MAYNFPADMADPYWDAWRYCPRCAGELGATEGLGPKGCPRCGAVFYPNPKPTASAVITWGGQVLLARRARPPCQGCWDLPGGFIEPDEDPITAVKREVREETGLEIRVIDLLGIFPDRYGEDGQPTLNIHYLAEAETGEVRPADDVAGLRWFAPEELPETVAFKNVAQALAAWVRRIQSG